jgi:hypothetical protein
VRKALCLCIGLMLCGSALAELRAAEPRAGREVKDLHYGDVLFYFYQDNFFEAITRLMAARAMGRAEAHAEDGDLLMGGMLLSYGQHQQAAAIFQRLLDTTARPDVRDRAWFYLARVSYERGALDQAEAALGHIKVKNTLPARMDAERQMLQAQVLMEQNRFDEAAKLLSTWKGPNDWANYARFNLGVALVRAGRVDEGSRFLDLAGNEHADKHPGFDAEQVALRDRANLALGYAEIQAQKPEAARIALQRVRLEGPYSSKALLGLGWADSALDRDSEALVPWMELKKRDLLDPAVQESMLAVPYAMARLKVYGQAARSYEEAIKAFEDETQRLDASIARIRGGQLVPALLADDPVDRMGWGWQLNKLPKTDESRYLTHLMASRSFQEGLKNYRDLRFLRANLVKWSHDVAAYSDMLATQKLALEQRQPVVQQALQHIDLDALGQQQQTLTDRLAQIESKQDSIGLANGAEQRQWASMQSIGERIDKLGDVPEAGALRDQLRLLKGVLRWNLDHDYKLRLWQEKRALAELDQAMSTARAGRKAVDDAQSAARTRLADFGQRIDQQPQRITTLLASTDALLARQQAYLQDVAIDELEQYKQRLHSYTVEAQFALAQTYDRSAAQQKPAPTPAPAPAANASVTPP